MTKTELFQTKLDNTHGKERYLVLGNYIDCNTRIKIKCLKCNEIWNPIPKPLVRTKNPTGCPNCSNRLPMNNERFKKYLKELSNNEYLLKGNVINSSTPVEVLHTKCNKIYKVRPNDFQQGYRCPYCSHPHSLKTHEQFVNDVKKVDPNYEVIGKYINCHTKIKLKHLECNKTFDVRPRNFLSIKTKCPYCSDTNNSKGIKYIRKILNKLELEFIEQVKLENLKYRRSLVIDIYIKNLDLYLEFDGQQHFIYQKDFGSIEEFNNGRKRDSIKNKYFIDNKLNLLRIDYINIENIEIILKELKEKRSTTIEKYNCYYIENGNLLFDNNKYLVE